jgi:hypothetical protein
MFELVYLHPFTGLPVVTTDERKVQFYRHGVEIAVTDKSALFVPWTRVTAVNSQFRSAVHTEVIQAGD